MMETVFICLRNLSEMGMRIFNSIMGWDGMHRSGNPLYESKGYLFTPNEPTGWNFAANHVVQTIHDIYLLGISYVIALFP